MIPALLLLSNASPAQVVLARALDAHGCANLSRGKAIYVSGKGYEDRSAEMQGPRPESGVRVDHAYTLYADYSNKALVYEHTTGRHDGTTRHRKWVFLPQRRNVVDFGEGFVIGGARDTLADYTGYSRRIPHLLLQEMSSTPANVKTLTGNSLAFGDLRVIFEQSTGLLSAVEQEIELPLLGKATVRYRYEAYTSSPDLGRVPGTETVSVNGRIAQFIRYESYKLFAEPDDRQTEVPDDYKYQLYAPETVVELAPGAYLAHKVSGFNLLFVEFKDYVVAVEAPASQPTIDRLGAPSVVDTYAPSRRYLEIIQQKVGKPVRYLVLTHLHGDHAGGVRLFADAGATIVTTTQGKQWLQKMGITRALAVNEDVWRLTEGAQSLEVHSVGKNPHTDEMLCVYLPGSKVLFQGDLFYYSGDELFPTKDRLPIMKHFAQWLRQAGLKPEKIFDFHGTGYATSKHTDQILSYPDFQRG